MYPARHFPGIQTDVIRRLTIVTLMLLSLAVGTIASSTSGEATEFAFQPGDAVTASTDALNVRDAPGTSSTVIAVLHRGDGMTVLFGPTWADGYTWYEVDTPYGADGWVAGEYLCLGSGEDSRPFIAGETVVVDTERLNVRAAPSLAAAVLEVLARGKTVKVTGDPAMADGYVWYPVEGWSAGPFSGWLAGMYLLQVMSPPEDDVTSGFPPESTVRVVTDSLNVRTGPGLTYAVIRQVSKGISFPIGRGPVEADGYSWYTISLPDQPTSGWVAGEFLELLTDDGTGEPTGTSFAAGDVVLVDTPALNGRAGPGLGYAVEQILTGGAAVTVRDGPVAADGYHWYQVEMATGTVVWVIGEGLTA